MSNIDRAAYIMGDFEAARDLANEGLLAPDLPHPDEDGLWWPKVPTIGYVQRKGFTIHTVGGQVHLALTRDEALDLAVILTAAASAEEQESRNA